MPDVKCCGDPPHAAPTHVNRSADSAVSAPVTCLDSVGLDPVENWKVVVATPGGRKHITMDSATADDCCRGAAEAAGTVWYPGCADSWLVVGPDHMLQAHFEQYNAAIS